MSLKSSQIAALFYNKIYPPSLHKLYIICYVFSKTIAFLNSFKNSLMSENLPKGTEFAWLYREINIVYYEVTNKVHMRVG